MQKILPVVLLCSIGLHSTAQVEKRSSLFTQVQYTHTLSDITKGNNPNAVGAGVKLLFNINNKLKAQAEMTADAYIGDDKVLRFDSAWGQYNTIKTVANVLIGASFQPIKQLYISLVAGPSFIGGNKANYHNPKRVAIKPSVGVYFSPKQRWYAELSYINVFKREWIAGKDFTSFSLAIGSRIF